MKEYNDHELAQCETTLTASLALGWQILGQAQTMAESMSELGDIRLPPITRSAAEQVDLRITAPLYMASELEHTRLLDVTETLCGLYVTGAIQMNPGQASARLASFWKNRNDRFSAQERRAMFARLFGMDDPAMAAPVGRNDTFEKIMLDLVNAIYRTHEFQSFHAGPYIDHEAFLHVSMRRLVANLASRSGGFMAFAAREIFDSIQKALDILRLRPVQLSAQANGVWSTVQNMARRFFRVDLQISPRVIRAQTGQQIIAYIAELAPTLANTSASPIPRNHSVVSAAGAWLQATAELENHNVPAVA